MNFISRGFTNDDLILRIIIKLITKFCISEISKGCYITLIKLACRFTT